ncbi:conserved hypothetical protein, degenerate [Burkholderia pseudomallei 1106b]|uniref:Uncharacterized protein n=1 Tax=Burkholderia pseudomallei (strain 1106a) TaxID=357348 RepID=A3NSQ5_BURP0|nr:conserved hypothetical protein, degenerate [Burkholderia pseudomallei 1106a]AFR14972.1 hypothetical protein BPC006_I1086 [Burkholderia pseudomallei BPC006]EES27267.1 conserved hypothetical protein, degenerate [Burkholderia pseudomallei 1106b]
MHRFVAPIHAIVDAILARLAHTAAPTGEAGRCARARRVSRPDASFLLGRSRRSGKIPRFWPPSTAPRPRGGARRDRRTRILAA